MNKRLMQAKQMLESPNCVTQIDCGKFEVKSQTDPKKHYTVSRTGHGLVCTCPDYTQTKSDCKHIKLILENIKKNQYDSQEFRMVDKTDCILCKYCSSGNIKKWGMRKTKQGNRQSYKCFDCNRRFTTNYGFENMRSNDTIITRSLQMYYSGMSVRDIADCLEQEDIKVSHMTIYRWIEKYSRMTSDYLKGIVPRVSETWRTDEIYMKISGQDKYFYSMMDHHTRFMITKLMADTKGTQDVDPMFKEAKMITDKIPSIFISDGAKNFHRAWINNYKAKNPQWKDTEHIRHIHMKGDKNNNRMERLNGTIRDREVAYRGIKNMDSPLFDGFQTYYNFSKKHGSLDKRTPAECAGILVEGNNKWKTIIQNASLSQ